MKSTPGFLNFWLKSATWTQVIVLTASLTLQTFPRAALAEQGDHQHPGAPGPHPTHAPSPAPSASPTPSFTPAPPVHTPTPQPTHSPTPPPTHTPTPTPTPTLNLEAARQTGRMDETPDGAREGRERGPADGQRAGNADGFKQGFDSCAKEAADHAHDEGFRVGYDNGAHDGENDGVANGTRDGGNKGMNDGSSDGLRRADINSNSAATPLGQAEGVNEANASDAADRGQRDGNALGAQDALAAAQSQDYPRGRKDYRDTRYAEQPLSHNEIAQKGSAASAVSTFISPLKDIREARNEFMTAAPPAGPAGPDYRYLQLRRTYPTPQENEAYAQGARSGYAEGFQGAYSSSYDNAYRMASEDGRRRGCEDARHRDYREDFERGAREGRDRGYHEAYDRAYRDASASAYQVAFTNSSASAYNANYDVLYKKHFEEARSQAYSARSSAIYTSARDAARSSSYAANYPTDAQAEYKHGQSDEAKDFAQRPVRITGIEATETIVNGVFEPGEPLRVHVQLRNFAGSAIRAQDVGLQISAQNPDQSVITIGQEYLRQPLMAKSLTEVREALGFQLQDIAVGRVQRFNVAVTYQGKVIDSTVLEVIPQYLLEVSLAETPSFKEGIAMPVRVKLTNVGNQAVSGVVLSLKTNENQLEVAQPTLSVGAVAPGESKVVEFSAVGRELGFSDSISLALTATDDGSVTGRRVGALDLSRQFPVINDYRIDLANNAVAALRNPGVVSISYTLQNESRRLMYNSLQVNVRFLNTEDPSNFVVIGPNPQYLMPIDQGESTSFVIPVMVKSANKGGVIEVEVQEAGRTVVIHREDFSLPQQAN